MCAITNVYQKSQIPFPHVVPQIGNPWYSWRIRTASWWGGFYQWAGSSGYNWLVVSDVSVGREWLPRLFGDDWSNSTLQSKHHNEKVQSAMAWFCHAWWNEIVNIILGIMCCITFRWTHKWHCPCVVFDEWQLAGEFLWLERSAFSARCTGSMKDNYIALQLHAVAWIDLKEGTEFLLIFFGAACEQKLRAQIFGTITCDGGMQWKTVHFAQKFLKIAAIFWQN